MAISDLRNKLKATPVASMESADQALDKQLGREQRGNSEYHKFENGKNVFRLYPAHEAVDPATGLACSFAEPKVTVFLPALVMDRDAEGKEQKDPQGKILMKMGSRPVFNSTIHGKKDAKGNAVSKDLVDEFIRISIAKAAALYPDNEDARKKYLQPIFGFYSQDPNKRVNGITYRASWVSYADKIKGDESKFALLEYGKSVKNRLNTIAAIEGGDDPLGTDPFTDVDEGRAIVILYNNKATKADDYYTTEIDSSTSSETLSDGRTVKVQKTFPLTDEQVEHFFKQEPLAKVYRNVFKRSDLDIQLFGLREIDKKGRFEIFDSVEFQTIAEVIAKHYPVESTEDKEETEEEEDTTTSTEETSNDDVFEAATNQETKKFNDMPFESKEGGDEYDAMSREELKEFAKDNNTGIIIKPASVMSDDVLRDRLRQWEASLNALPKEDTSNFEKAISETAESEAALNETEEAKETPAAEPEKKLTPKEKLEAMRAKNVGGK